MVNCLKFMERAQKTYLDWVFCQLKKDWWTKWPPFEHSYFKSDDDETW